MIIAELVLVVYLSARVDKIAPSTAGTLFLAYSALNGVTFALILLAYTGASVANAFFVTAGMFGALAVYGSVTKRDLSGMGRFMFMGLIGLVLAGVVSIFWQNNAMQFVMGVIGVLVFSGLIAYDTQRLRAMALQVPGEQVGLLRRGRRAQPLPRLHQPLPLTPPALRRPPELRDNLARRARRPRGCRASSR